MWDMMSQEENQLVLAPAIVLHFQPSRYYLTINCSNHETKYFTHKGLYKINFSSNHYKAENCLSLSLNLPHLCCILSSHVLVIHSLMYLYMRNSLVENWLSMCDRARGWVQPYTEWPWIGDERKVALVTALVPRIHIHPIPSPQLRDKDNLLTPHKGDRPSYLFWAAWRPRSLKSGGHLVRKRGALVCHGQPECSHKAHFGSQFHEEMVSLIHLGPSTVLFILHPSIPGFTSSHCTVHQPWFYIGKTFSELASDCFCKVLFTFEAARPHWSGRVINNGAKVHADYPCGILGNISLINDQWTLTSYWYVFIKTCSWNHCMTQWIRVLWSHWYHVCKPSDLVNSLSIQFPASVLRIVIKANCPIPGHSHGRPYEFVSSWFQSSLALSIATT